MDQLAEQFHGFWGLALALGIGLVVGLERGWKARDEKSGDRTLGIRTFALLGLMGGVSGLISVAAGDLVIAAALLGTAILIAVGYVMGLKSDPDAGQTTEIAALATVAFGALAVRGDPAVAAAGAVAMVLLLDMKQQLHDALRRVQEAELSAVIKLLLISVVILPVLPDEGFGPYGALNPYVIWWSVVLLSTISFASYAAIRLAGPANGPLIMGALGGLASSTAVTVNAGRLAATTPALAPSLIVAVLAASASKLVRVSLVAFVLAPALVPHLGPPLAAAFVVFAAAAVLAYRRSRADKTKPQSIELKTPADIGLAIFFGAILAVVMVLVAWAEAEFGHRGLYVLAAISGLADFDALNVTVSRMAAADPSAAFLATATGAILLAVAIEVIGKVALSAWLGGVKFAAPVAATTVAAMAAAAAVFAAG